MTTALQLLKARMQDPEFNRRFTEAVLADKKVGKEDEDAYKRIQAKYPTSKDLPFELPKDFRDM